MDDHLRPGKPGAHTLGCWDAHIASRVAMRSMSSLCFFSLIPAVPPHGARPRCTLLKSAMNPGVLACQVPVLEHGERFPGHFSHDFHLWLGKATCFLWEHPSFYRQNLGLKFEDLPLDAFGMESGSLGRNGLCWNMLCTSNIISGNLSSMLPRNLLVHNDIVHVIRICSGFLQSDTRFADLHRCGMRTRAARSVSRRPGQSWTILSRQVYKVGRLPEYTYIIYNNIYIYK